MDKYDYVHSVDKFEILKDTDDLIEIEVSRSIQEDLHVLEKIEVSNFMIRVEEQDEQR